MPSALNILYIDDDEQNLMLFKLMFEEEYQVYIATSAEEGKKILAEREIALLISDQRMPGMTGTELFEETAIDYPETIRVLLTAYTDVEEIIDAINVGKIFQYVTKPFDSAKLKVIIDHSLEIYTLRTQNKNLVQSLSKKNQELKLLIDKIKEEESKFKNIFNSSNDAVLIISNYGNFLEVNNEALNCFENLNNNFETQTIFNLFSTELKPQVKKYIKNLDTRSVWESEIIGTNKAIKHIEFNGKKLIYDGKQAILLIARDITDRKNFEKKLLQAIISTEEQERSRFARDLHDGIGPLLSTAKLNIQWMQKPESKANPVTLLNNIEETLNETVSCIREISNNLSPHVLNSFGLIPALNSFIDRITVANNHKISFTYDEINDLNELVTISLYRIICECVNNALKHAHAKSIHVSLKIRENTLLVTIKDNGIGFDIDSVIHSPKGLGIMNMQSRINTLEGKFNINSILDKGTEIYISLQLNKATTFNPTLNTDEQVITLK